MMSLHMKVRVLGCSGGIGGANLRTTALLVDSDILIDAGTGVGDLSLAELASIDHIFLTHSHLDHIASIPFLVDTVGDMRKAPITIWALQATIDALRKNIFNWVIWPDFAAIPSADAPSLVFRPIDIGQVVEIGARRLTVLPANHVVPAVGYAIGAGAGTFAYTGDTTSHPPLWDALNRISDLRYLVIETAFSDIDAELAERSRHINPTMLARELGHLRSHPEVFITHLKPSQIELIMHEVSLRAADFSPRMLRGNQVFTL